MVYICLCVNGELSFLIPRGYLWNLTDPTYDGLFQEQHDTTLSHSAKKHIYKIERNLRGLI
jgi:hypothetical protein